MKESPDDDVMNLETFDWSIDTFELIGCASVFRSHLELTPFLFEVSGQISQLINLFISNRQKEKQKKKVKQILIPIDIQFYIICAKWSR